MARSPAAAATALSWDGAQLRLLDQTLLPARSSWIEPSGAAQTADAIRRCAVRGAPLIGIAAAYGMAIEIAADPSRGERRARVDASCAPRARPP